MAARRPDSPSPFALVRDLDGPTLAAVLGLAPARERDKYACLACGSSDAVHGYDAGLHCFACGRDAVDIASVVWNLRRLEAARRLLYACGASLDYGTTAPRRAPVLRAALPALRAADAEARRRRGAAAAAGVLGARPLPAEAWEWLRGRGLAPDDAPLPLDVHGVPLDGWPAFLRDLRDAGASEDDLDAKGLSGRWRADFAWLAAVYRDPHGAPDAVRLRTTTPPPAWWTGDAPSKWRDLRGCSPAWPWRAERARGARTLVICEGETDAMACELAVTGASGVAVLAAPGAAAWRAGWGALLAGADRVLVLADKDNAGEGYAARVLETCAHADVWRVARDGVKDAADLWRAGRLRAALAAMGVLP